MRVMFVKRATGRCSRWSFGKVCAFVLAVVLGVVALADEDGQELGAGAEAGAQAVAEHAGVCLAMEHGHADGLERYEAHARLTGSGTLSAASCTPSCLTADARKGHRHSPQNETRAGRLRGSG